jgi:two-component system phosphate regulon response regulator PhoB
MQLILIVEDEYGTAEVLQLMVEAHGYRVASASNGQAALELLAVEKPAAILSDFMMPRMNGAEMGIALRANPAWCDIPFIFISGTNEEVVQASFSDYDGFFSKPVDVDLLLASVAVMSASGRRSAQRSRAVSESMRQLLKGIEMPPAK